MARKNVNIELNLTPFIGLFAMLVVMLLLTAVWNHVYTFASNTSNVTGNENQTSESKKTELSITILLDKIEMAENERIVHFPHVQSQLDLGKVVQILSQWRAKYPEKKDVVVNTDNRVAYSQLIEVFDTLVGQGWPDVGVNTQ